MTFKIALLRILPREHEMGSLCPPRAAWPQYSLILLLSKLQMLILRRVTGDLEPIPGRTGPNAWGHPGRGAGDSCGSHAIIQYQRFGETKLYLTACLWTTEGLKMQNRNPYKGHRGRTWASSHNSMKQQCCHTNVYILLYSRAQGSVPCQRKDQPLLGW